MEIILFIFLTYGITNILIFGSVFRPIRDFFVKHSPKILGKLSTCPMCLSTWVGFGLSYLFGGLGILTPFLEYGVLIVPLRVFLDGCFVSSTTWLIHTIQEYFERSNPV